MKKTIFTRWQMWQVKSESDGVNWFYPLQLRLVQVLVLSWHLHGCLLLAVQSLQHKLISARISIHPNPICFFYTSKFENASLGKKKCKREKASELFHCFKSLLNMKNNFIQNFCSKHNNTIFTFKSVRPWVLWREKFLISAAWRNKSIISLVLSSRWLNAVDWNASRRISAFPWHSLSNPHFFHAPCLRGIIKEWRLTAILTIAKTQTNIFLLWLLRVFGLSSSSLLLFPQRFGRYVHRPSSNICRTREPTQNFELRPLLNPHGSPVLIPWVITGYKC